MTSRQIRDKFRSIYLCSDAFGWLVDQMLRDHPELRTTLDRRTVSEWVHKHGMDMGLHQDITAQSIHVLRDGVRAIWPTSTYQSPA